MGNVSLLVHKVDNNIENIEILLSEKDFGTDGSTLIGQIIKEQMNKILENAELYYLEDDCYAKNKDIVFLLEYVHYLFATILEKYKKENQKYYIFPKNYKGKAVKTNHHLFEIQKMLNYLFSATEEINGVEIQEIKEEFYIQLNLEKKQEHSLQTK